MLKEALKDTLKYVPALAASALAGIITIPIITRLFCPSDYGEYAIALVTINTFFVFVAWLSKAIIRFYPVYEKNENLNQFYTTVLISSFIVILIVAFIFIFGVLLVKPYISQQLFSLLKIGVFVFILLALFSIFLHFLRAKRQVNTYSGFEAWRRLATPFLGILLVVTFNLDIQGLLWGFCLSLALALPLLSRKAIGELQLNLKGVDFTLTKKMLRYGFPLIVAYGLSWIINIGDRYIIKIFRPLEEVGIYSASYGISEMGVMLFASLFMLSSEPIGINIWERKNKREAGEFLTKITRYYLMVCLPLTVGIIVLAQPLIYLLIAPEYHQGFRIVAWVSGGVFFFGLQHRFATAIFFSRKTYFIMLSTILIGALNIGLNLLLIPSYGYMAAAVTTFISYVCFLVLIVVFSRRLFVWSFPGKSLVKIIMASTAMGLIVYFTVKSSDFSNLANLILGVLVGVIFYSGVLFLSGEIKREDFKNLGIKLREVRSGHKD